VNCRSIPQPLWEHVRQCLIFYFSRRHGIAEAEDLAHETLLTVWNRRDYEFEKEEDFPRVCYAFARRILRERYREMQHHPSVELDPDLRLPVSDMGGLTDTELSIFVKEVLRVGESELREKDWKLIENSLNSHSQSNTGNLRVYLHRARKRLARLTGWRRAKM
jgi:DNA-directed RNA polymerase specialized sigma24 family protein